VQDTFFVGCVLLAVVPFVVWDAISTMRGGFDNAFWARSLEGKMDHIPDERATWHRIGIVWVPINLILSGGLAAFVFLLAGEGEAVWGAIGLGVFLLLAAAFLPGALLMMTTVSHAAEERRQSGSTPAWVQPVWQSTWWIERAFIVGANLAYVAWGVGIVKSGFPAPWAGWVAIVTGTVIAAWASLREYFFQHMVLITPLVLGVALLLK
jgi:hypothetical protein